MLKRGTFGWTGGLVVFRPVDQVVGIRLPGHLIFRVERIQEHTIRSLYRCIDY